MKTKKNIIAWLLPRLVIWRLLLFAVVFYAIYAISFKESFPYKEILLEPNGPPILWSWANFDGVHYLTIAKQGYSAQFTQAFFPLFPILINYFQQFIENGIIVGLVISHLSFFIALVMLFKLIRLDWGESTAKKTIIYLLLFPTSFYFVSLYSESLFLALTIGAFYAARRKKWWIAGLLGAVASATRVFGIFLLPALLIEWYQGRSRKNIYTLSQLFKAILPISISASGLLCYMYYLYEKFSDPILFLTSQPAFGAGRSSDKLILLYQVFWRYAKMVITVDPANPIFYTILLEIASGIIFLFLAIYAFKKTRLSYAIFSFLSYIAPTLTGTFSSMPRYVLILFPCFILLGAHKDRRFQRIWLVISAILLAINTALFTRGYWIA